MRNGALSRSSSVQHILRALRRDIIRYRYKDGQQIRELELAAKYDASRAAVRCALMVLEKEGLIVTHKNGTRTVSCLSRADMDNYHDLRAYLETVAVEEVARGDKNMEGIFEVVNKIRMLDERNTHEEIQQLNSDFHGSIILASGNKAVIQAWSNIEPRTDGRMGSPGAIMKYKKGRSNIVLRPFYIWLRLLKQRGGKVSLPGIRQKRHQGLAGVFRPLCQ